MNINHSVLGRVSVFLSVASFSVMVILVKYITSLFFIPAIEIAFFRFLLGFFIVLMIIVARRKKIKPINLKYLLDRGISNSIAVVCFYITISKIPVTKANLYNMTYPIFVAVIAHFTINEKLTIHSGVSALLGFCGVLLILRPEGLSTPEMGDLWGLASGFTAGYSIVSLKRARTTDEPITILLFIMGCGLVMSSVIMPFVFVVPNIPLFLLLVCTSILAVIGQLFITYGFRYVSSLEGSIISSMRIFVVAILGVLFMGDRLTWSIFVGALVITFSIVLLNVGQDQSSRQWVENGK